MMISFLLPQASSIVISFNGASAAATDDGTETPVDVRADGSIVLQNVIVADLVADDFLFM